MESYSIDFKSVIKGESHIWNITNDLIVLHWRHLRCILQSYVNYYHNWRTHRSPEMDAPKPRPVQVQLAEVGPVRKLPEVGGLHHHYERMAA